MKTIDSAVGFVLGHCPPDRIVMIALRSGFQPPTKGQYVYPAKKAEPYTLEPLPIGFIMHPGGKLGQGSLYFRKVELPYPESIGGLPQFAGGFLCGLRENPASAAYSCLVSLQ